MKPDVQIKESGGQCVYDLVLHMEKGLSRTWDDWVDLKIGYVQ